MNHLLGHTIIIVLMIVWKFCYVRACKSRALKYLNMLEATVYIGC